ncbi:unnamed protein product [Rhizopus stolonifer]
MFRVLDNAAARNLGPGTTLKHVLKLAQELRNANTLFDLKTYEHILSAYSKAGKYDKVIMLLDQMETQGVKPERVFFDKALQLAARFGHSTLQAKLLLYMEKYGIPRTTKTYRYIFSCMRENMELERALDTFSELKKLNIRPSALSYLDIIHLAVLVNQPLVAFDLLCSAKHIEDYPGHDEFLYLAVLRSAAYNNEYGVIKTAWKEGVLKKGFKPDEGTCLHILNIAGKQGDPRLSSAVIDYLGKNGFTYRECHFQLLIESFAAKGDMKATFELFHVMRTAGIIPNRKTVTPIISIFVRDKNAIRNAKDALNKIASTEPEKLDITAFNLVIHVLASKGEHDDALSVLNQIYELKLKPNSETLDAALDICIHDQNIPLGVTMYKNMISDGIQRTPSIMSKMVTLMCTSDDYEDAFKYLEEMKQLDMIPYRGSYYKLVKKLATFNDPRLSVALEDMDAYGYELSTHLRRYIQRAEEELENKAI